MTALRPLLRDETYRPFGPGIHVATGSVRFMGVLLANHSVVIESEDRLVVWNPIALTPKLRASLAEVERTTGRRVGTLIAGLDYHHFYLRDWQASFPDAKTFLVSERITDQQPNVRGEVVAGDRPALGVAELDVLSVRGCLQPIFERSPKWKNGPRREWFTFHRPSRTLLVGEMFIITHEPSWLERKVLRFRKGFNDNGGGFRIGDRAARDAFLRDVIAWDAEQAITVHGTASAHGAEYIRSAFERRLSRR